MEHHSIYRFLIVALVILLPTALGNRLEKRSTYDTLYAELSVVEEQSVESFSENLDLVTRRALERSGVQWSNLKTIHITLLEPNSYFRICPNDALNASFLCLKKRIDRELLCPTEGICCPRFQQSQKAFETISAPSVGDGRNDDCAISLILMVDLVSDFDESKQQRLLSLTVRVLDINDHAPTWILQRNSQPLMRQSNQFNSGIPVLHLPIREYTKAGTKIELPEAVDPDAFPENTTVNYGIESGNDDDLFSLEWTGKTRDVSSYLGAAQVPDKLWLVINKELNRDEQKSHQLKIFATDGGAKPQVGYLLLSITVEDINNHPPKFEKKEDLVWVLEHSPIGSVIYRLRASDQDESDLEKLEYSLSASVTAQTASLFTVDKRSGEIRVQGELDYEKVTSYQLPVIVTDGLWFDEAIITIGTLNINDHPPVISLHSHLAANSRFQHMFDSHHHVSGSQMTIEVMENGPPDQLIATFTVTDGDDLAEVRFLQSNTPLRDAFLQANGLSLQEAVEKSKQPPRCKLNTDLMEIELLNLDSRSNKARFQLRLARKPLDREVSAKYLIRIECWDQANRFGSHILTQHNMVGFRNSFSRSSSVMFTLVVLDENDSVPQFVGPLTGGIAEGQPVGTLITQISASDADDPYTLNGQAGLRYTLIGDPEVAYVSSSNGSSQNSPLWFTLDPRSGELRSAVVFDREIIKSLNLTVSVSDGGLEGKNSTSGKHNSATTTMYISVTDVNDCHPVFDKLVYQLNISEGASPPLLVGQVHANDCDADETNHRMYYWLHQQPSNSTSAGRWFTISRSGEIYLGSKGTNNGKMHEWRPLDREKEELIVLEVMARDHGQPPLTGSAQVIIRLQDVNDNSPVWHFPKPNERVINVSTDASVGQRIAELSATDADEGDFGKVVYSIISGNEEGHFELDEQSGCLYISKPFTAASSSTALSIGAEQSSTNASESVNLLVENRLRMLSFKTFRLYLRASDKGDPPRTATAVLDVRLSSPGLVPTGSSKPPTILPKTDSKYAQVPANFKGDQKTPRGRTSQQSFQTSGIKIQQYQQAQQQDPEGLISTESLIIIAVMVAAVAALLFIVILLTTACLRKRIVAEQSRRQVNPLGAAKPKPKGPEFELQFTGDGGNPSAYRCGAAAIGKKIYGVSSQPSPFIDSASTYLTVTRNTLKRDSGGPNELATTYTVQSFDNVETIPTDMLSAYRFERGQQGGILVRAPSSSLLTMDQRVAQSGTTEESIDISESSSQQHPQQKEKMVFGAENGSRKMNPTSYAVTPQTLPRNPGKATYVALSPASIAYTSGAIPNSEGVLLGGKCFTFSKQPLNTQCSPANSTTPFLVKLGKPGGLLMDSDASSRTYTPLNFAPSQQHQSQQGVAVGEDPTNQESSFV